MAGRPRLVEEGTPLWGNDEDRHEVRDHAMRDVHPPTSQHRRQEIQSETGRRDQVLSKSSLARESSLSRATGSQSSQFAQQYVQPYHLSTRVEIGRASEPGVATTASAATQQHEYHHHPRDINPSRGQHQGRQFHVHGQHQPLYHVATRLVVGGEQPPPVQDFHDDRPIERMEGVEHDDVKGPLVVIDGANVAYAYADAMAGLEDVAVGYDRGAARREPDPRGIQVAANYFQAMDVRVLVVLPASWFRAKPRSTDIDQSNAMMLTPQLEVLKDLKAQGLLLASPPADDDDAYALTVARREDARAFRRGGGGGFVLSCDMFRDAVRRDTTTELKEWLLHGSGSGPGRISFAFCDLGSRDDYGDREMDFVPNPRHELVQKVEHEHRQHSYQR